jgi:hypothetical protein
VESLLFILLFTFLAVGLLKCLSLGIEAIINIATLAVITAAFQYYFADRVANTMAGTICIDIVVFIDVVYILGFIFIGFLEVIKFARNYIKG